MAKKLKVAVLMGGKSPEHDISVITGKEVVKNLNPQKYDVLPIFVSRDGITWKIGDLRGVASVERLPAARSEPIDIKLRVKSSRERALTGGKLMTGPRELNHLDVVFIAMHGPYGEDGTVQGFLELIGVPYTGSGVLASALAMDKISSRKLFTHAGLKVPRYEVSRKGERIGKIKFGWPVFVKPHNQGSSVGASIAKNNQELKKALKIAWRYAPLALIEEYIAGTEVTCPILGNEDPKALPLVEIVPKKAFFDWQAKYNEDLSDEIVPAMISKSQAKKAQEAAIAAYQALGCRGFGRVDMIIKNGKIYVLEVNTIPGLTPVSLFPKSAKAAGISYPQLLDEIIHFALEPN